MFARSRSVACRNLAGLDGRGAGLDKLDNMLDDIPVRQPVIGKAGDIDLMGSLAAAGQADISLALRPARSPHSR